jgi:60 kDa SS-A/Ro ribonucleoprotein
LNKNTSHVITTFSDENEIRKSRLHPITILIGMKTYAAGKGFKGSLSWTPEPAIIDVLDKAFYKAFQNVEATGKRFLLGLDVSGSMDSSAIANSNLTAREAVAAMALVTASVENQYDMMGFSSQFVKLGISPGMRLDAVIREMARLPFARTDCSLPIEYAIQNKLDVDVFVIYTDNETYAGRRHPTQALAEYRKKFNKDAKMIVVATSVSAFTIADPNDAGMLDVAGFDSSVPAIIADFVR